MLKFLVHICSRIHGQRFQKQIWKAGAAHHWKICWEYMEHRAANQDLIRFYWFCSKWVQGKDGSYSLSSWRYTFRLWNFAYVHSCQWGKALRGIKHEQKDAVQQLSECNGWLWNVEVTDVCETKGTALSMSTPQALTKLKLLSLEVRQNSLSSTQWFSRQKAESEFYVQLCASVIFKWWSDFQIFVINQQWCDCVILWRKFVSNFLAHLGWPSKSIWFQLRCCK